MKQHPQLNSANRQPVFVLGLPASRIAWLTACLSAAGGVISCQGMREQEGSFEPWAEEIDRMLPVCVAGDGDSRLCAWIPEILERWPRARFIVVSREQWHCLEVMVAASPAEDEQELRKRWPEHVRIFRAACDRLRFDGCDCFFTSYEALFDHRTAGNAVEFAIGYAPNTHWLHRWQMLRVTSVRHYLYRDDEPASGMCRSNSTAWRLGQNRVPAFIPDPS